MVGDADEISVVVGDEGASVDDCCCCCCVDVGAASEVGDAVVVEGGEAGEVVV